MKYENCEVLKENMPKQYGMLGNAFYESRLIFSKEEKELYTTSGVDFSPTLAKKSEFEELLGILETVRPTEKFMAGAKELFQNNINALLKYNDFKLMGFDVPKALLKNDKDEICFYTKTQYETMAHYMHMAKEMGKYDEFMKNKQIQAVVENMLSDEGMIQSLNRLKEKQKNQKKEKK